jgi:hypothetical protein
MDSIARVICPPAIAAHAESLGASFAAVRQRVLANSPLLATIRRLSTTTPAERRAAAIKRHFYRKMEALEARIAAIQRERDTATNRGKLTHLYDQLEAVCIAASEAGVQ